MVNPTSANQADVSAPIGVSVPNSPRGIPPASSNSSGSGDTVGSMSKLKSEHEEIYNAMLESLGMDMCNKMKKQQEEAKKKRKEAERDAQGG